MNTHTPFTNILPYLLFLFMNVYYKLFSPEPFENKLQISEHLFLPPSTSVCVSYEQDILLYNNNIIII